MREHAAGRIGGAGSVARRMATAEEPASAAPAPCPPCKGKGQVISQLGGTTTQVVCPWCEGGGVQIPGHDAQAARRARDASA